MKTTGKIFEVKISELKNWSVNEILNRSRGKFMYLKKDGLYEKIDELPKKRFSTSWFPRHQADEVVWLTPQTAEKINTLLKEARDLEEQAKKKRARAKAYLFLAEKS